MLNLKKITDRREKGESWQLFRSTVFPAVIRAACLHCGVFYIVLLSGKSPTVFCESPKFPRWSQELQHLRQDICKIKVEKSFPSLIAMKYPIKYMLCHAVSWGKSRQKYWSSDLRSAVESREKKQNTWPGSVIQAEQERRAWLYLALYQQTCDLL